MTIPTLRPCPFCGGTDLHIDTKTAGRIAFNFVFCRDCWAEGPVCTDVGESSREGAALAWNGIGASKMNKARTVHCFQTASQGGHQCSQP